jgi:hypothetical protein
MDEFPKWKQDLPSVPHPLLNDIAKLLSDFYTEHLRRDVDGGRLKPSDSWMLIRGYLIAGIQTYAAICILLSKKRPKPLMLQAGVLNRSLFEILVTVTSVLEDPVPRTQLLLRESYKSHAKRYQRLFTTYGDQETWSEYLDVYRRGLEIIAKGLRLSSELVDNPDLIPDWPTPGKLIYGQPKGKGTQFVSGTRQAVLKEIYEYHYADQSAQAHGRIAAMAVAMLVDQPDQQWDLGGHPKPAINGHLKTGHFE